MTDGFGGRGGIAKFNRDLLASLCSSAGVSGITALPRLMPDPGPELPEKLALLTEGLNGKIRYVHAAVHLARCLRYSDQQPDLIICGHINLLPVAFFVRIILRKTGSKQHKVGIDSDGNSQLLTLKSQLPIVLFVHGIDAWQPSKSWMSNLLIRKVDALVSVSEITRDKCLAWARLPPSRAYVLPCCVELSQFAPGPKPAHLLKRYGLEGRTILLTFGRLVSKERAKGFDEVLEILPGLGREISNLAYMIAGDGDDRLRMVAKARSLGLAVADFSNPDSEITPSVSAVKSLTRNTQPLVLFTGYIQENEKADHYRMADLYVMPSSGEGFGIVYLEALACGLQAIGSKIDGSREALRNGELGTLIDPGNPEEIMAAIRKSLAKQSRAVPPGLDYFSYTNFQERCHCLLEKLLPDIV